MAGKQIGVTLKFIDDFTQGFNASIRALTEGTKNAQRLSKQITKAGESISKIGKSMTVALTVPIVALGTKGVKSAMDFEKSIAKIMTLEDKLTQYGESALTIQSNAIEDITKTSKKYGIEINEVAGAYYNLASAFNETKDIAKGLDVANMLARAGETDVDSASKALAQIYNAYGGDLEHIGDILAQTQNFGFTTIADLSGSMGKVMPTAKAMGVELEDVYTAMAVLTSAGIETAEAATYLDNAFKKATENGDRLKLANGGLYNYLLKVNKEMDTFDKVQAGFKNIRATKGIVGLSDVDLFKKYREEITNSTGALRAMDETIAGTNSEKMKKALNNINLILMQIGQKLLPVVDKFLTKINEKLEGFNLSDEQIDGIIKVAGVLASIGPALMGIGTVIKVIGAGLKIFNVIKGAFVAIKGAGIAAALASPLGIVLAVVAAIAAVVYVIHRNFDKIKPAIDRLLTAIRPFLELLQMIGGIIMQAIGGAFEAVVQKVGDILTSLIDSITSIFTGVGDVLYGIFTGNFELIGQGICEIFSGVAGIVSNVLLAPVRLVAAAINGIIGIINGIKIKVPDWVPGIGGKGWEGFNIPTIPDFAEGVENFRGGLAHINEEGGEIVDLPQGSRVIPHDVSMAMAKTGQNITISLAKLADSIVIREEGDIDKFTSMFSEKLVRAYINS